MTINTGFICCYDPQKKGVSFLMSTVHSKHKAQLLLIGWQPRHKLHRDQLYVTVLPYKSVVYFLQEEYASDLQNVHISLP